jgi:hypothetical protein
MRKSLKKVELENLEEDSNSFTLVGNLMSQPYFLNNCQILLLHTQLIKEGLRIQITMSISRDQRSQI